MTHHTHTLQGQGRGVGLDGPRLVLFFPGTRLRPENYTHVATTAAAKGLYVLSLDWVNWGCRTPQMAPPACMNSTLFVEDAACTVRCYATPLHGGYASGNATANPLRLTPVGGRTNQWHVVCARVSVHV